MTDVGSVIAISMCSNQDRGIGEYEGTDIINVIPIEARDLFELILLLMEMEILYLKNSWIMNSSILTILL